MQKYTYICWIHTDAINKDAVTKTDAGINDAGRNSLTIFYLSLYCKVRKGCSRVSCERKLEIEYKL